MNRDEIRAGVHETLARIAPEADLTAIRADRLLRRQIDLDSMDWLNVIVGLHERFGLDIPGRDYGRLGTLDEIVDYLVAHLGGERE
ncbi:acyl carrier protein [Azoarcus sp. L1K30]|uniref:acyl carrier protein n=1 Tax=Azoarcus sp. L1K30 TaxID=2820277 RepID=UPI001B842313|nr:acyl carrier protein [Azoarcus sp. L1K30]MBR0565666.1 acyl carrier protein [Azoarcus sp. L1K30]